MDHHLWALMCQASLVLIWWRLYHLCYACQMLNNIAVLRAFTMTKRVETKLVRVWNPYSHCQLWRRTSKTCNDIPWTSQNLGTKDVASMQKSQKPAKLAWWTSDYTVCGMHFVYRIHSHSESSKVEILLQNVASVSCPFMVTFEEGWGSWLR